jgi:hypothetical protein
MVAVKDETMNSNSKKLDLETLLSCAAQPTAFSEWAFSARRSSTMSKDRHKNQPKVATFLNLATIQTASGNSDQQISTPPQKMRTNENKSTNYVSNEVSLPCSKGGRPSQRGRLRARDPGPHEALAGALCLRHSLHPHSPPPIRRPRAPETHPFPPGKRIRLFGLGGGSGRNGPVHGAAQRVWKRVCAGDGVSGAGVAVLGRECGVEH